MIVLLQGTNSSVSVMQSIWYCDFIGEMGVVMRGRRREDDVMGEGEMKKEADVDWRPKRARRTGEGVYTPCAHVGVLRADWRNGDGVSVARRQ